MESFFIQNSLLPYIGLDNLRYTYIRDLTSIDEDTKKYILSSYVVLNTLFDSPKLKSDLGMSYFALINYFKSKDFLLIIADESGLLYRQCKIAAANILSNIKYLFPVDYNIQTNNIIRSVNDFNDQTKVIETSMLLANYYCKPSFSSIKFDYVRSIESGGFVPGE